MAKLQWAPFPYPKQAFDYPGAKLEKAWPKLHAGDQEPFPDEARVARLLKAAPALGKSTHAAALAARLADAWRAYHRGDFEQAFVEGSALGPMGAAVAGKAMGIHATYLVDDPKQKQQRFAQVAELAEAALTALPEEANAHYVHAFGLGRFSQSISIAKALARGLAGKIKQSLDTTLALAPKHAEAHLALATYHAEIVAKVGAMLASLTYSAKASTAEQHLKDAQELAPDAPIVWLETGNTLLLLYGERREDDAAQAFAKASKLKPLEAMQALDAATAKSHIE